MNPSLGRVTPASIEHSFVALAKGRIGDRSAPWDASVWTRGESKRIGNAIVAAAATLQLRASDIKFLQRSMRMACLPPDCRYQSLIYAIWMRPLGHPTLKSRMITIGTSLAPWSAALEPCLISSKFEVTDSRPTALHSRNPCEGANRADFGPIYGTLQTVDERFETSKTDFLPEISSYTLKWSPYIVRPSSSIVRESPSQFPISPISLCLDDN